MYVFIFFVQLAMLMSQLVIASADDVGQIAAGQIIYVSISNAI
jgi:hypothetical protein